MIPGRDTWRLLVCHRFARLSIPLVVLALAASACSSDRDADPAAERGDEPDPAVAAVADLPGAQAAAIDGNGVAPLPPLPDDVALPMLFVHGFAGSAQQFESQAMRFVANGYPQERILVYEHDGAGVDIAGYSAGVGATIDDALVKFGVSKVYLIGHSRGTTVSSKYLGDPANAAKVAKYIAIDGAGCVDAVPCLAPTQETNPGQSHVEVATSKETFASMYDFLLGAEPEVVDILPQRDPVVLTGRAVNFPANTGRAGVQLDVWAVDPATGARDGDEPHASFTLDAQGGFGPFVVASGAHYEWVLSAADTPVQHHLYLQPYVRSSHLVRLLSSGPDGPTRLNTNVGDDHAAIIAIRMREWYALDDPDGAADERDLLRISTSDSTAMPPNAIVEFAGNAAIGLHIHDDAATPGQSSLAPLPYFADQPFQSGIDVFIPGADPPDATVTVTNIPRGADDEPQVLSFPNWASSGHAISVVFTDYPVD
jgi:pimeloyl-ACP methyl ester carboxylesterase